jgi:hypothetical protein
VVVVVVMVMVMLVVVVMTVVMVVLVVILVVFTYIRSIRFIVSQDIFEGFCFENTENNFWQEERSLY